MIPEKTPQFHSDPNINIVHSTITTNNKNQRKHRRTSSNPTSPIGVSSNRRSNRVRNRRRMARSGAGAEYAGAGGAGALPITNKTINIHDHWELEEPELYQSQIK